jgi:S1-C subfamily serine protease
VTIVEVDAESAKKYNIGRIEGVIVLGVRENSSAVEAGIEYGDQIIAINGVRIDNPSQLQEQIGRYRPNDRITITILRNNRERQLNVVLRNPSGGTGLIEKMQPVDVLGASFGEVTSQERKSLGINNGVKVVQLTSGKFRNAGIREGFIITEINNTQIKTPSDVEKVVNSMQGGIYVEGVYPDGLVAYYSVRL